MEYLHPSVSSKIIDNSVVFLSAQGITQLFCAFTSDLGPDNQIQQITSPSEFLFHYGSPNMRKHGQAAYNIMNWLNAHGGLLALRVAPDNAGFSHAFVDVQTKTGTKQVKAADGTLVTVPDVSVRTTVAYTGVNNNSNSALEAELNRTHADTVDGFQHNYLFAVSPKGRGKAYDNLGFRLTLTDAFDETYNFRLYNFEVTKTLENGSTAVVDGPFLVSLSPDAVSSSNESLFIKYVVEKYSVYYNVIFNEAAFDKLGTIVNPDVNPSVLDFISGSTRQIGGASETFYNAVTKKDEDVHLSVQKYNGGVATGLLNYVDGTSSVESAVVDIDDALRNDKFASLTATVQNMKVSLSNIRNSAFGTYVDTVVKLDANSLLTGGSVKTANDAEATAYTVFTSAETAGVIGDVKTASADSLAKIKAVVKELHTALDISRAVGESAQTLSAAVSISDVESGIAVNDIKAAKTASQKDAIIKAQADLGSAITTNDNGLKLASADKSVLVAQDAIAFARSIQVMAESEADPALTAADTALTTAKSAIAEAKKTTTLPEDVNGLVNTAVTNTSDLLTKAQDAVDLAMVEVSIDTVKTAHGKTASAVTDITTAVKNTKAKVAADSAVPATKATLTSTIEENIVSAEFKASEAKVETFNLKLHDFNSFVPFSKGSDGDLDDSDAAKKATATKDLLIKAYKGLVDVELTNKKLYPIDVVLDANYPVEVKSAITELCTVIRKDFIGLVDTGFQATPKQAIDWRKNNFTTSSFYVGIFAQDFIVYDEFTGQDIKVTSPYYLASKIPAVDEENGIHVPFVGPRRGTISGFKKMSWNPTEPWKEQLYKKQINYVESDPRRTKFGSQLTSQTVVSALSNINNVRALLRIQREVEELAEDYQFEFNDGTTLSAFQYNLNGYLTKWTSNRACDSITGQVYASAYDRQNKQVRVKIEAVFNSIIERVLIDLVVNK